MKNFERMPEIASEEPGGSSADLRKRGYDAVLLDRGGMAHMVSDHPSISPLSHS